MLLKESLNDSKSAEPPAKRPTGGIITLFLVLRHASQYLGHPSIDPTDNVENSRKGSVSNALVRVTAALKDLRKNGA